MGRSRRAKLSRRAQTLCAVSLASSALAACAGTGAVTPLAGPGVRAYNRPYQVHGRWYAPASQPGYDAVGVASWYSYESPSRTTADGEPFDARLLTAAHTTLPIPSYLDVTNLENGRTLRVRLNDRGPFAPGRIIDLSRGAAERLGFLNAGTARVRVRYVGPAPQRPASDWTLARVDGAADSPVAQVVDDERPTDPAPLGTGFGVQVATFADVGKAERAAARLTPAGPATIRPLDREGVRVYRVVVGPWSDEASAWSARARVAALGFTAAEVVRGD